MRFVGCAFIKKLGLLSTAAFVAASFAGGDYLVHVGPKALHFAAIPVRKDPEKVLPPLTMTETTTTNAIPAELTEPAPIPEGVDDEMIGPVSADPGVPDPAPETPQRATPDTLLQFFAPGTKRNTVISTPVEFAPPAASGKSSSATYISQ